MWNFAWTIWLLTAAFHTVECMGYNHDYHETYAIVREISVSKRSLEPLPDMLTMHVVPDNRDPFLLALTRTRKIQPDDVKLVLDEPIADEFQGHDSEIKISMAKKSAFYSNKQRTAILSVTHTDDTHDYKRTLFGTVILNGETYEIRPSLNTDDARALSSRGLDPDEGHMLHTLRRVQLPKQAHDDMNHGRTKKEKAKAKKEPIFSTDEQLLEALHKLSGTTNKKMTQKRQRRQVTGQEQVFDVELTFLLDYTIYEEFMEQRSYRPEEALEGIHNYYAHIYHGMYLAYADIDLNYGVDIDLWLKEIHVATTRGASNYVAYLSNDHIDDDATFAGISRYMRSRSLNWLNTDHIMFWSRYRFGQSGNILGVSRVICGVCQSDMSITVNHDYGLFSYRTGAHEIGHNFGAYHDYDLGDENCEADDLYLMTPSAFELTSSSFRNSFVFSECSVNMMVDCFRGTTYAYEEYGFGPSDLPDHSFPRTCVLDTPEDCEHGESIEEALNTLPGEKFDIDEQCKLATGDEAAYFNQSCQQETETESICRQLLCVTSSEPGCSHFTAEMNAEAGTPCDFEKNEASGDENFVCWKGGCVPEGSFSYTHDSLFECPESQEIEVPYDCEDQEPRALCLAIVYDEPWRCFGNMIYECAATCTEYGLFNVDYPPCKSVPQIDSESSWKYELCGYDMWDGYFVRCPNHDDCIPMWYVGDAWEDCPDAADEDPRFVANVPSGFVDYVRCPSNLDELIVEEYMCDEHEDCPDASDEVTDHCNDVISYCDAYENFEINCPNDPHECIPLNWLCDGIEDCGFDNEATDEDPRICDIMEPGPANCEEDEYPCSEGGVLGRDCIGLFEMCDGFNDCYTADEDAESEDENKTVCNDLPPAECQPNEFSCPESPYVCWSEMWLCDGWVDCYETEHDESPETCRFAQRVLEKSKKHHKAVERVQLCEGADGKLAMCETGGAGRTFTKHMAQAKLAAQQEFARKLEVREKRHQMLKKGGTSRNRRKLRSIDKN